MTQKTKVEYAVEAYDCCVHCDGAGWITTKELEETEHCPSCYGMGVFNERKVPFEVALADMLDQDDVFNRVWNTVELMQDKINELEGRIKRLGG